MYCLTCGRKWHRICGTTKEVVQFDDVIKLPEFQKMIEEGL